MVLSGIEKRLADQHPTILKTDIRRITTIILTEITEALDKSQAVELRGFGRFSVVTKKSRIARNPQDGSRVEVGSKKAVKWKCSKKLFNLINNNFTENKISDTN